MKKIISILIVLCFCNLILTDIYGAVIPVVNNNSSVNNIAITNNSLLPVDIGKFVQDMYVLGERTVINIQDLHSDENTQKNIVSILEFLVDNYNIQNIYFEGAIGTLNFGWLNSIKDEKLKESVAKKLLQDGKITGAEYFGFFNKKKNILFKGLEEEKIYKENFVLLEQMYENRNTIQKRMNLFSDILQKAGDKTYNYKLKILNDLVMDYNNKNISQADFYYYLFKLYPKKSDFELNYKTIANVLKLDKKFNSLNIKKLEEEISLINKDIKNKLTYEQYSKLQKKLSNYPNQYYNDLFEFVLNDKSEKKYVEFVKFLNCLKQKNSIDIISLFQEEQSLCETLYDSFSETFVEKNLIFLNYYTNKLLQFFTNSLPSFEYQYIKNNFDKYCILLENYISNTDITEIKQWYKITDKFYSNNEKRNLYFLETLLKKKISKKDFVNDFVIKNDRRKSFEEILQSTNQPVDIMVTGGYHSQGLKELMAKLNINYAVIMPNIRTANIKNSENKFYKDYLKQYSILANTYQKFIRSSVMNTTWNDPVKVMVGTFFDYSLLQTLFENLKNSKDITEILKIIQQNFTDILKSKGLNVAMEVTNIENINGNSFVVTVLDNGKERLFYISQNVVGEIQNKQDISKIEKDIEDLNSQQPKTESSKKKILKKISRFISIIFVLPVLMIMGGGGGISFSRKEIEPQPKKGLTDKGAQLTVTDADQIEYIDTVIDKDAKVNLNGKIILDNVFVGKDNKLTLKAGKNTSIVIKNIDLSEIGELDITIEDNGEYEIVSEEGIVKVYKVLQTDFSSSAKKRKELVSILKKGSLFLPNESEWNVKTTDPVIVLYGSYGSWSHKEEIEKRTDLIYKDKDVIYINVSDFTSMGGEIDTRLLIKMLEKNNLQGKNISVDFSLIEERFSKPLMELGNIWLQQTNGVTFLNTNVPISVFVKSEHSFNRLNKHFYLNTDGSYKRYPYKDRNWLKNVLQQYLPDFKEKTFVFVWPVESVKYTYFTPKFADGGTPEQRVSAFEPFKQFMDKAIEYSSDGKDSIAFIPGYLIAELSMYLKNPDIGSDFVDITYGESEEANPFSIWYKKKDAKQIEKIEVLKLGNLTIVMYPEGNRGHNEQAYLKTLMATYNFGKESFDGMLTQAGFTWKSNTVYVFEGKEMEDLDMEAQLLRNPSIKTGKVSYVYENLKRVFIDLYTNMERFFKAILPKFTKGNWISVEEEIRDSIDMTQIKESVTAKSKLGFDSFAVIPVRAKLLDEQNYGTPVILEQDGKKVSVYTLEFENSKIFLIGVESKDTLWQDCVLSYVRDFLRDYRNNIISFDGLPQISAQRTKFLFDSFIPVVLNSDDKINGLIQTLGYDDIIDTSDIVSRIGNTQLKYPHVASDMREISETIKVIKSLKRKSFLGQFAQDKTPYVGVKIASDEHIFNNEMEENEFIEILKGTDIDFVTVVIRDNDLGVHVLNRETTVKENLTKLSQQLHNVNKEIVLEYTFRFIDEFFKSFVRTIQEDCKDMNLDGIKLDLADCSVEDIGQIIGDLKTIRESLTDLNISLQVSNKVWEKYSPFLEELNITRTVSSKEELLMGEHDLSADTDINYEISIYKNQQEYEQKVFSLSNQRDRLMDKDPENLSSTLRSLIEMGEERFADQIIDNRLEAIFQKVVLNDSIGKLILPVNMLYAQRLKDNENSNVIQAVSNLIRLFKESKGMNERREFAYQYGLQQNVRLTDEQEKEIAEILRGENKSSAGNYVRKYFPYVFDYFVESRQTRIEISDSFLFGVYEANIIRKYKEGQFGKVLEFVLDTNAIYDDTQEAVDERQALFYKALAQLSLYKNITNVEDLFYLSEDEYKSYEGKNYKENYLNAFTREIKQREKIYHGMIAFQKGFPLISKMVTGYMPNREETLYEAQILLRALSMAYKMQETEPVLPEIPEDRLQLEDAFIDEDINSHINELLASA